MLCEWNEGLLLLFQVLVVIVVKATNKTDTLGVLEGAVNRSGVVLAAVVLLLVVVFNL